LGSFCQKNAVRKLRLIQPVKLLRVWHRLGRSRPSDLTAVLGFVLALGLAIQPTELGSFWQ
jgi:hypothetical protein